MEDEQLAAEQAQLGARLTPPRGGEGTGGSALVAGLVITPLAILLLLIPAAAGAVVAAPAACALDETSACEDLRPILCLALVMAVLPEADEEEGEVETEEGIELGNRRDDGEVEEDGILEEAKE